MSTLDKNLLLEMFRKMEEIRRMDLKIAQLVKKGKVPGMTHFSVGEEAANVGAMTLEKSSFASLEMVRPTKVSSTKQSTWLLFGTCQLFSTALTTVMGSLRISRK